MNKMTLALLLTLALTPAASAQTRLTLSSAVSRALQNGPDVTSARANLQKAQANLRAVRADPTSIITTLTQAEQDTAAQAASLQGSKLSTAQTVIGQYTDAYEAQSRINLARAQVNLDERNLQIARARLQARVATQLDVNRAQTALSSSRQKLADAQAQLPVQEAKLARLLGLNSGTNLVLAAPPTPPKLSVSLATLQSGLEKRLPRLVQAANGVALAQLQVKLSNNDYTPARTLQDAQIALANAQRGLNDGTRASSNGVSEAYRAVQSAQQQVNVARQQASNAQTALSQAQARLKAGTAAAIEVQQAQVQSQQATLGVQQAQDGLWQALAALSAASGTDVTGLVN